MENDTEHEQIPGAVSPSETGAVAPRPRPFRHEQLASLILRFLNRLKQGGRSAHTISAYRNDLNLFAEFLIERRLDPQSFTMNLKELWLHHLGEHGRRSQASARRALMSVRTFLHFLVQERIIIGSPLLEIKSPRGQPTHDLLTILPEHFRKLNETLRRAALTGDDKAARDWALVLVLGQCGLKASEAAGLTWADVLLEPGDPHQSRPAGGSLRVVPPNERILRFDEDLFVAFTLLKKARESLLLDTGLHAKLFFGYLNISRKTRTDSLHRHGIKFVVYEVCQELLQVPYNSESLRNHAILRWLDQGLAAQQVADLAGYSSLNSLERFSLRARGTRRPKRQMKGNSE